MTIAWFVLGCIAVVLAFILILVALSIHAHYKELVINLTSYQINSNSNINKGISDLLQDFINDCFTDVQVLYFPPSSRSNEYINDDKEAQIRKALSDKVASRMSDALIDKLSLLYNRNKLNEVIADKIFITVTAYVVDHNATYNSSNR